jgi:hypothetical protein
MQIARTGSRLKHQHFHSTFFKTGIGCRPYLLQLLVTGDCHGIVSNKAREIAPRLRHYVNGCRLVVGQRGFRVARPRRGPGTAGSFTQLVMAIVVYGASALVVGAGLIGAVRRR